MKKLILTSVICIFILSFTKAEYTRYIFQFEATLKNKQKISGYIEALRDFHQDSLANSAYALKFLKELSYGKDTIFYFKDLLNYKVKDGEYFPTFYELVTPKKILKNNLIDVKIPEVIISSYRSAILSTHKISDTTWMKTKAMDTIYTGNYLCDVRIYAHDASSKTKKMMEMIRQDEQKFHDKFDSLYAVIGLLKYTNPDDEMGLEENLKYIYNSNLEKLQKYSSEYEQEEIIQMQMENKIIQDQALKLEHFNEETIQKIEEEIDSMEYDSWYMESIKKLKGYRIVAIAYDCGC